MITLSPERIEKLVEALGDRESAKELLRKEMEENGLTERATVEAEGELSRLRGECEALRDRVKAQDEIIHGLMGTIEVAARRLGGEGRIAVLPPVVERAPETPRDYASHPETPQEEVEVPF